MKPYKGFVSNVIGKCILQEKGVFFQMFLYHSFIEVKN